MNSEKSGLDPTRIGQRLGAGLDRGFEAFSGFGPTDKFRPLNSAELRDLRTIETGEMTSEEVIDNLRVSLNKRIEVCNRELGEWERTAASSPVVKLLLDGETKRAMNEARTLQRAVEERDFSRLSRHFLNEAQGHWRVALELEQEDRSFSKDTAKDYRRWAERDLQKAAFLAQAI